MWIILLLLAGVILLTLVGTWISSKKQKGGTSKNEVNTITVPDLECCGAHEICDKETLLSTSDEIIYYDDEELDQFAAMAPEEYTQEQGEAFREVLYTMQEDDVAGWLRSLQLRNIQLPYDVREEALMIVAEVRDILHGVYP